MAQLTLRFRPEAEAHIEEAFESYSELTDQRLVRRFLQSLDDATSRITSFPNSCAIYRRHTRRILLHRFPYWVYFQVNDKVVEVVAMLHVKRDPSQSVWNRG